MTINITEVIRKMVGWCPDANITERKTRHVEYDIVSMDAGIPVQKWKFDLLIFGHICALLFASLFILPMSVRNAFDLYNNSYLMLNYGSFLADVTLSITSAVFSVTTIMLINNIITFKRLYLKLCYFNIILLSGLFAAIILELSFFNGFSNMEFYILGSIVLALIPSIPSFFCIKLDKMYGGHKIVKNGIGLAEIIKRSIGWHLEAEISNKNEELYIVSHERKFADKIRNMGFKDLLSILHPVFAVWLIITALWVLAKPTIFPWWVMDIDIISSGLLLAIGVISLMIFYNFIKAANVHRTLALMNITLLVIFFLYLSQFLLSPFTYNVTFSVPSLDKPYNNYNFVLETLLRFTLIIGMPSILTFFSKPAGKKKTEILTATLLILLIIFASIGVYYLYLNKQKDAWLAEESGKNGEYKIYRIEPTAPWLWGGNPYYLDSPGDTTGHPISKDTYEAIQFLRNKEEGKVLSWWDIELEIKAAGKEPVISYASEATKFTIGRFASLYTQFEPDEKVADVSRFFITDSEDAAKSIAKKYGASIVYLPKERMPGDIFISMFMGADGILYKGFSQDNLIPEDFEKRVYESSMAYKFNNGMELKYFEKTFENKDVIIYQLK